MNSANWNVIYGHSWPDPLYDATLRYLESNQLDRSLPEHVNRTFRRRARIYSVEHGKIVFRVSKPPWVSSAGSGQGPSSFRFEVVKASERDQVLKRLMHDMRLVSTNAHMMADRVHREGYLGISRRYIHRFLTTDKSTVALRIPRANTSRAVIKSFRPAYPFQHWQMDLMDFQKFAVQNRAYKFLFMAIDIFTKFIYIAPIKNKSQKSVAQVLNKIFLSGDIPDVLHSDNGKEFKGDGGPENHVQRLCQEFKVKQIFGDTYSPQTQGFVENKNKQIKTLINYYRINNNTDRFVDIIDQIAFTVNNSKHTVTGYTPMELHRGRRADKNFVITEEDIQLSNMEDPTDADLENYFCSMNRNYNTRVHQVARKLKEVASKREKRLSDAPELKPGAFVHVLSYESHGPAKVQGVFIRVGENEYPENPLRVKNQAGVSHRLTDMAERPRSLFSALELKGPRKFYKQKFIIESVVKTTNSVPRYHLVSTERSPVWLKRDTTGTYKREFTRSHLVLYNVENLTRSLEQIRPNPLFIDLTVNNVQGNQGPPAGNNNNRGNQDPPPPTGITTKTCSIQSILKNKRMLKEYKPYLFVVFPDRFNNGSIQELAVYRVRLMEYDNRRKAWVYESEKDRNNPRGAPEYELDYLRLDPRLYNKMGTDSGWRFEDHNYFLIPREGNCSSIRSGHYATNAPDTKLVEYRGILNDPSYEVSALLNFPERSLLEIRYAFNVFQENRPTGGIQVKTGTIISRRNNQFSVRFPDGVTQLELRQEKYGKLLREIEGWEFFDFNYVFNLQLQRNISLEN